MSGLIESIRKDREACRKHPVTPEEAGRRDGTIKRRMSRDRVKRMEAALLAAEEMAKAVEHERTMACQDMDLQFQASQAVERALDAYREATR